MKRVKAACLCHTLHFQLKEDLGRDYAAKLVQQEVQHYKDGLDKSSTRYKILEETVQPDGSVIIKIKKQYNNTNVGDYFD